MDLISRKAVINEMKDMYTAAEKWGQDAKDDETRARAESCMATNAELKLRVEKLPSVQPNLQPTCNKLATDCIDRRAAIDALNRHLDTIPVVNNSATEMIRRNEVMDCRGIINDLPSVQSEHTETHSCDYQRTVTHDLVSRQASIDSVCEVCENCEYFKNEKLMQTIKDLPSVQPQRWIPVTERVPEECGEYLVTKRSIGWNCEEYYSVDIAYYGEDGRFHKANKIFAWIPLPEPYAERREDGTRD